MNLFAPSLVSYPLHPCRLEIAGHPAHLMKNAAERRMFVESAEERMMTTCMWPDWEGAKVSKATDSDEGRPDSIPSDSSTDRDLFSSLHGSPNFLGRLLDGETEAPSPVDRSSISYGSLGRNQQRMAPPLSPDQGVDTGRTQRPNSGLYFRPIRGAGARQHDGDQTTPDTVSASMTAMSSKWDSLSQNEQDLIQKLAQLKFEGSFANSAAGVGAYRPSVLPDDPYDPSSLMSNVWVTPTCDGSSLTRQTAAQPNLQSTEMAWPRAENSLSLPQRWTASAMELSKKADLSEESVRKNEGTGWPSHHSVAWEKPSCWSPPTNHGSASDAGDGGLCFSEDVIHTGDTMWPNEFASGPPTLSSDNVFNIWNDNDEKRSENAKNSSLLFDWILRHERPEVDSRMVPNLERGAWCENLNQQELNGCRYQPSGKPVKPSEEVTGLAFSNGRQQLGGILQPIGSTAAPHQSLSENQAAFLQSTASEQQTAAIGRQTSPGYSQVTDPLLVSRLAAFAAQRYPSPAGSLSSAPMASQTQAAAPPAPSTENRSRQDGMPLPPNAAMQQPKSHSDPNGMMPSNFIHHFAPNAATPTSVQAQQQAVMNSLAAAFSFVPPAVAVAAYNNMAAGAGNRPPPGAPYPVPTSAPNNLLGASANPFLLASMAAAMATTGVPPGYVPALPGVMPPFAAQQVPAHFKLGKRSIYGTDFHSKLEDCMEEYKLLEKERKKTEAELARNNLGKKINSQNSLPIPRPPANPSRLDRLLVDYYREHARMITLLGKMEQLISDKLPNGIHSAMQTLVNDIKAVHSLRTAERNSRIDEKGMTKMIELVCTLTRSVRCARSALFSGLTLTIDTQRSQRKADNAGCPEPAEK